MAQNNELCLTYLNLSEVVVRADDTLGALREKIELATILGTFQSTLTSFPYLRKIWQKNTEEERLLGVSLTGIMDNEFTAGTGFNNAYETFAFCGNENWYLKDLLENLKQQAVDTNEKYSTDIGINSSVAITCVKPSGTVSQLVDSASGIHARHSGYYIRSVRGDNKDPLTRFLIDSGIPSEPEVNKPDQTTVFYFPIKSPDNAVTRNDMTAIQQLELWKTYQLYWCEHKPSVTVTVKEDEWPEVGSWVWNNFDMISGVSFLPHTDHTYRQAPYQECDVNHYNEMVSKMPKEIRWEDLSHYELEDTTTGMATLACSADGCEIVDIG